MRQQCKYNKDVYGGTFFYFIFVFENSFLEGINYFLKDEFGKIQVPSPGVEMQQKRSKNLFVNLLFNPDISESCVFV